MIDGSCFGKWRVKHNAHDTLSKGAQKETIHRNTLGVQNETNN